MENSPTVNDVQSILCRKNIILLLDLFHFFIPFPPIFLHYLTKLTDANLKEWKPVWKSCVVLVLLWWLGNVETHRMKSVCENYLVRPRSVLYCLARRAAWDLSKRPVLWHVGWWVTRVLGTPETFSILLPGLWPSRRLGLSLFTSCAMPEELWEDGSLHARPWALFLFGITRRLMTDASLSVNLSCSLRKMGEAFSRAWGIWCPGRDQHRDKSLPPLVA